MSEHSGHPNWVSVSVVALMNVATKAHSMEAEAPSNAARLPAGPLCPSSASSVAVPATAAVADAHAPLVGSPLPPLGSAMAMNNVSETQVRAAAHQVTGRID
jgi:hypothetical protein